jgi:hypothetical protein
MKDGPLHLLRGEAPAPAEEGPTYETREAIGEICIDCQRMIRGRAARVYVDSQHFPHCAHCVARPRR